MPFKSLKPKRKRRTYWTIQRKKTKVLSSSEIGPDCSSSPSKDNGAPSISNHQDDTATKNNDATIAPPVLAPRRVNQVINYAEIEEIAPVVEQGETYTENEKQNSIFTEKTRRICIAVIFEMRFGCEPNEKKWHGRDGIIPQIRKIVGLPNNSSIDYILRDAVRCKRNGLKYTGESKTPRRGGKPALSEDSQEAKIIATQLQKGSSQRRIHELVQEYRKEKDLPPVKFASVYSCIKRTDVKKVDTIVLD